MFSLNKIILLAIAFTISIGQSLAQEIDICSTDKIYQKLIEEHPEDIKAIEAANRILERKSELYQKRPRNNKSKELYIIPVVFHILHQNGSENISDEQIFDAMRVVNEDFRRLNADTTETVEEFRDIAADTKIEFRLAKLDPSGNCTNGIDRIYTSETFVGTDSSKLNQWPREKYLNIWVVAGISSGAAGYAYYPASTVNGDRYKRDGIVILNAYVGSVGTGNRNRSRALTHEIGHYLNLVHLWGNTNNPEEEENCLVDDGVFDTPLTLGHRTCTLGARTCDSTLDNVQNYMEYSYCYNMFTIGQRARMHATLDDTIADRNNLHNPQNLIETGVVGKDLLCQVDFGVSTNFACINDTVVYFDKSYHNPTNWLWNLEGAVPKRPIGKKVTVKYSKEGIYDAFLYVMNEESQLYELKEDFIHIYDLLADYKTGEYVEDFEQINFPEEWLRLKSFFGHQFEIGPRGFKSKYSAYVNNFEKAKYNEVFSLISPTFDLSYLENPKLSFSYAFSVRNNDNTDKLSISYSTDCGKTWNLHFSLSGSQLSTAIFPDSLAFVPDSNEWRSFTFPIISTVKDSSNVLIKFEYSSGGGNNFYLDNINVFGKVVGINENYLDKKIQIYPNPFKDEFTIKLDLESSKEIQIDLYDIGGRIVKSLYNSKLQNKSNLLHFNLEGLPSGMFFVRTIVDGQSAIFKIVNQ